MADAVRKANKFQAEMSVTVKQGYGKVESKGGLVKWKKKWIVLKDSKVITERKILLFKNEKESKSPVHHRAIALENIYNVELSSGSKPIILLIFKDDCIQKILFSSEAAAKEWHEQLCVVCFGSVLGKSFESETKADIERPAIDVARERKAEDHLIKHETFATFLQPSAKLSISGDCYLEVTPTLLQVFDSKCSNVKLVSWPIGALRRFGFDAARFTFEAGRRCDTGEGIFVFKTQEGEKINQIVQDYARKLATTKTTLPSAQESDNEEFEFRPLPPIPPD